MAPLPKANSPNVQLDHPTRKECVAIWTSTSNAWKGALTPYEYVEEAAYLLTVPLNKDGGMTIWILTDKTLPPEERPILASCETIRKRTLISDSDGNVKETITHGVASVYTNPAYRGQGYASRLMKDLGEVLQTWQSDIGKPSGSILFSDIGKKFYGNLGWLPFRSSHVEFEAVAGPEPLNSTPLLAQDLAELCRLDESMLRKAMSKKTGGKTRMAIIPDEDSMLWFHRKEEFLTRKKVFDKPFLVKGAVSGKPGNRVWMIWDHFLHGPLDDSEAGNTLYILRLVIENEDEGQRDKKAELLKNVIEAAQAEAAKWKLPTVEMWNPTLLVEDLLQHTGIHHIKEDRKQDSICSLMWYGDENGTQDEIEWVVNEKFEWL